MPSILAHAHIILKPFSTARECRPEQRVTLMGSPHLD